MRHSGRRGWLQGGLLGLVLGALGLVAASPFAAPAAAAPAPENCGQSKWKVGVSFLALQAEREIVLAQQPDGTWSRDVTARVFCTDELGNDIGEVIEAGVNVWVLSSKPISINGQPATDRLRPVRVDAPSGLALMTISSPDKELLDVANGEWRAVVARDAVIVTEAFGHTISLPRRPLQLGRIWAQTPEMGSLALFGSGAAGMAGYALVRLRAIRGRQR